MINVCCTYIQHLYSGIIQNKHVMFVLVTIQSFVHHWTLAWLTWRFLLDYLLTIPEHSVSPPVLSGVRVAKSLYLNLWVLFCWPLFVFLSVIHRLTTSDYFLVSSNVPLNYIFCICFKVIIINLLVLLRINCHLRTFLFYMGLRKSRNINESVNVQVGYRFLYQRLLWLVIEENWFWQTRIYWMFGVATLFVVFCKSGFKSWNICQVLKKMRCTNESSILAIYI